MTAKKQRGNNDGAVLLTVLTVACFAAILLTAVLSFVGRAHTNAYNNYNSEQAYYIASSALGSIHDYFEEADGSYTKLLEMANANSNAGTTGTLKFSDGSDTIEMSELVKDSNCTVKVSRMGDGYIKLSVTGYCRGQAETINAYYTVEEAKSLGGIDNALYCDGLATFDKKVSSAGPLTTRKDYFVQNSTNGNGTIITGKDFRVMAAGYYWKSEPGKQAKNYIIVSHNFRTEDGAGADFIPLSTKQNDNTTQYIAIGGQFQIIGATHIGEEGREMDVYCSNVSLQCKSEYKSYGNIYCYKLTQDEFDKVHEHSEGAGEIETGDNPLTVENSGDFTFNAHAATEINGDVYVEGNVIINDHAQSQTINGDLHLGAGSRIIDNTSNETNRMFLIGVKHLYVTDMTYRDVAELLQKGTIIFKERIKQDNGSYVENILLDDSTAKTLADKSDSEIEETLKDLVTIQGFSHDVPTSREYKPDTSFETYQRDYEITEEYLKKHTEIKSAYESATDDITKYYVGAAPGHPAMHDYDIDLDIGYYIHDPSSYSCILSDLNANEAGNETNKRASVVLIDLNAIGHDYVIKLKPDGLSNVVNLTGASDQKPALILVKNGERNLTTGEWIKQPEHNLYVIADDGASGTTIKVDTEKFGVMDYYTYYYVIKNKYAINLTSYIDNNNGTQQGYMFVNESESTYKDKSGTVHGIYTPPLTRNYLMINPGDVLSLKNTCSVFLECVVYAPKAEIDSTLVYGYDGAFFLKDSSEETLRTLHEAINDSSTRDSNLCCLGAMICDKFTGQETFGVSFFPPCPDAGLGGSKTTSDTEIKFSHYESR